MTIVKRSPSGDGGLVQQKAAGGSFLQTVSAKVREKEANLRALLFDTRRGLARSGTGDNLINSQVLCF